MSQNAIPAPIDDCQRRLGLIDTELTIIERETAAGADHTARRNDLTAERQRITDELAKLNERWEAERDLVAKIDAVRAKIDAATATTSGAGDGAGKSDGQTERAALADLSTRLRTALTLAQLLYGGEQNATTINMAEFKEEHKVSLLMGSPPGYVGYGEGGVLTEAVRRRPYSVVLLDEMEKAHAGVQDVFYSVFDKGNMKDGEGRDIDFKNTVIIMTSNAGTDLINKLFADPETAPDAAGLGEALRPELAKFFKPAFLGRVTLVPYFPLPTAIIRQIVTMQLERIRSRVRDSYRATFDWTPELVDTIAARCTESSSGARNVENILTRTLLPELSAEVLARLADGKSIQSVKASLNTDGLFFFAIN
ncbi:MAG: AAA domain-containing protein [Rhodospirillales bacterium]|nr:AAA domain-containing protein [Rhodospirillales bacterium]